MISKFLCVTVFLLFFTILIHAEVDGEKDLKNIPLATIGLVADNHYDTFPAGEKAPWQPMNSWLQGQVQRTSTTTKRRYDIAKDKMLESVEVFNKISDPRPLTFAVNLGDLVNNDLMWNLKPILDAFNQIKAPKFSILGNHDLRGHNDRFGKNNRTQELWIMNKLGLKEWFYEIDYAPFMFIFLDSMVMEEPESNPKRRQQLKWLKEVALAKAKKLNRVVVLFGHISIGLTTSPFAPLLKEYPHIVGGFFGHHHKGGYMLQEGYFHTTIIQGQIETLTNAFAVLELFVDRMELTGFGRVPTRVMKFEKEETRELIASYFKKKDNNKDIFQNIVGKASSEEGYEPLIEGGKHQPAAEPEKVFPKNEVLQKPPPLNLNIPNYRKPLVAAAEPNLGETRFLKQVYKKWPRREKTLAPEDAVDLNSYKSETKGIKGESVWYQIAGSDVDPAHKGKILQQQQQQEKKNIPVISKNRNAKIEQEQQEKVKENEDSENTIKNKNIKKKKNQNIVEDNDDENPFSSSSSSEKQPSSNDDKMFYIIEAILVVAFLLVMILIVGTRLGGRKLREVKN